MERPVNYQSIPPTPAGAGQQPVPDRPWFRPFPTTRRTLSFYLALFAAVAAVAATTICVTRIKSKPFVASSLPFGSDRAWNSGTYAPRFFDQGLVARAADLIVDKQVGTGDCTRGFYCRARLIITLEAGNVTVKAGYSVNSKSGKPRDVNAKTKSRISKFTYAEATKWATKLIAEAGPQLEAVGSHVMVEQIATAIMGTKDTVMSCTRTGDSQCLALQIAEAIRPNPTPSPSPMPTPSPVPTPSPKPPAVPVVPVVCGGPSNEACESLFLSPVTPTLPTNLTHLRSVASTCREVRSYRDATFVCAPFCSASCGTDAGARHNVYARFVVSGSPNFSHRDCFAQALLPMYRSLHNGAVPKCEDVSLTRDSRGAYTTYLAGTGAKTMPSGVAGVGEKCEGVVSRLFFGSYKFTLEQLIAAKCALVAP